MPEAGRSAAAAADDRDYRIEPKVAQWLGCWTTIRCLLNWILCIYLYVYTEQTEQDRPAMHPSQQDSEQKTAENPLRYKFVAYHFNALFNL